MVPSSRPKSNLKVPAPRSDFSNVQIHSVHFMILHDDSVSVLLRSPNSAAKAPVLFPGSKTKGTLHRLRKKRILLSPQIYGNSLLVGSCQLSSPPISSHPSPNPDRAKIPRHIQVHLSRRFIIRTHLSQGVHMHITLKSQVLLAIKNAQTREFCPVY